MQNNRHPIPGYLLIAAAALCWGASAALGKAVFTGRIPFSGGGLAAMEPVILAQMRTTISLALLAPILLLSLGPKGLKISGRDLSRCLAVGTLGLAASNYFYYLAIQKSTVAMAITLQYVAPVWVLLYMALRGYQKLTLRRSAAVLLAILGTALAVGLFGVSRRLQLNIIGVLAAEAAGISFAFYNVAASRLVERHSSWKVLLYALLGSASFWAIINPPWKIAAAHYSGSQWLFLLIFAFLSMLLPFSCYFAGLRFLDPTRAIVTSSLEPVFAILIAALSLSESILPVQVCGIVLVLLATVLIQIPETTNAAQKNLMRQTKAETVEHESGGRNREGEIRPEVPTPPTA